MAWYWPFGGKAKVEEPKKELPKLPEYIDISSTAIAIIARIIGEGEMLDKLFVKIERELSDPNADFYNVAKGDVAFTKTLQRIARDTIKSTEERIGTIKSVLGQIAGNRQAARFFKDLETAMDTFIRLNGNLMRHHNFQGIYEHEWKADFGALFAEFGNLEKDIADSEQKVIQQWIAEYGELATENNDFKWWVKRSLKEQNLLQTRWQIYLKHHPVGRQIR